MTSAVVVAECPRCLAGPSEHDEWLLAVQMFGAENAAGMVSRGELDCPPFVEPREASVASMGRDDALDGRLSAAGFDSRGLKLAGDSILDAPEVPPAVWGDGREVLWPVGEPAMIAARTSLGKSTLAQSLTLAMLGIGPSIVLRWPVRPAKRVLYVAMDRPAQIVRSFRRLVGEADRQRLNDGLVLWQGPLPFRLDGDDPTALRRFAQALDADVIILDSLKDAMTSLVSDEAGQGFNASVQECAAVGVEVLTLHHNRKAQDGRPTRTVDDVYGSTFLTAGQGSVLAIDGQPGDLVVTIRQPKPAADEVAPIDIRLHTDSGLLEPLGKLDIVEWVRELPGGATAREVARFVIGTAQPTASEIEKARRQLRRLVESGHLEAVKDGQANRYMASKREALK